MKRTLIAKRIRNPAGFLLFPSLTALIVFFIFPTLVFLVYSFLYSRYYRVEWIFTLENYLRAFSTPVYWEAMLNSLFIGLLAASCLHYNPGELSFCIFPHFPDYSRQEPGAVSGCHFTLGQLSRSSLCLENDSGP